MASSTVYNCICLISVFWQLLPPVGEVADDKSKEKEAPKPMKVSHSLAMYLMLLWRISLLGQVGHGEVVGGFRQFRPGRGGGRSLDVCSRKITFARVHADCM